MFILIRVVGVLTLAAWDSATHGVHKDPRTLLSLRWDSLWYSRIAAHGYGFETHTKSGDLHSDLAFFPLLPMLERLGHRLTGLTPADVGLGVSIGASVVAAAGIYAVVEHIVQTRDLPAATSTYTVLLWAALPVGIVEWMAYSESLFTALAAWALFRVLTRRWLSAGLLAAAVGLTRPVGVGVVLAVALGATCVAWQNRRRPARRHSTETLRMVLGVGIAPLGLVAYVAWVAQRTGRGLTGYLDVQAGWRNGFDGGIAFARFIAAKFSTLPGAVAGIALIVGVMLALWALVACFSLRMPWPVLAYVVVLVALALGAKGYFGSKPRFFVPIFPLLIPLAAWLARQHAKRRRIVTAGMALFTLSSAMFGALWLNGSGPP